MSNKLSRIMSTFGRGCAILERQVIQPRYPEMLLRPLKRKLGGRQAYVNMAKNT